MLDQCVKKGAAVIQLFLMAKGAQCPIANGIVDHKVNPVDTAICGDLVQKSHSICANMNINSRSMLEH
jgi:hypothetical protein